MKNSNIILIEEQEKEDARALTQSFARNDVKSRAYINALGAEVCKKYFEKENISSEQTYNLHNIRKILEEFDISDIKLSNIHIDARIVFDENQIFIPKSHFEYNLLPDIYVVLKLEKEHKNTEILGFFEPKLINKNNANSDYYFIEKEKLSSPVDLKSFIENFNGRNSKSYTEEEMHNAEVLMVSMADNNVTEADKRMLLDYLINSAELRDEFIEFENFEMLSYQAASIVGFELPVKTEEMDVAQIPSEELSEDIAEEMIAEQSLNVEDNLNPETDGISETLDQGLIGNTAVLGAEIAGTAMISAALAGVEEASESAVINAAANVANITSEAIDMASSIQNMAEQVFADENLDETNRLDTTSIANEEQLAMEELALPEEGLVLDENLNTEDLMTDMPIEDINIEDVVETQQEDSEPVTESVTDAELPSLDESVQEDSFETTAAQDEVLSDTVSDEENIDALSNLTEELNETDEDNNNMTGSLDDLFGALDDLDNSNDDLFGENQNELEFQGSSSDSDDLVFENYSGDDEITFSNNDDYGDYVEYGDSSDPYAAASSSAARQQSLPQAHGVHTPISEATELMSLEDIKNGNIPPQNPVPVSEPAGSQMETMEMDEFHSLVESYVPTEIKNESETVGFDSIANPEIGHAETLHQPENSETEPASDEMQPDNAPKNEINTFHESDAFVEEMPEIDEAATTNWNDNTEPTSDDFVEEMPDEIENLASGLKLDEITSDDFIEDMPEIDETASNWGDKDEPTSDDFVEQMPDAIENDATNEKFNAEPTSDDFVEEMPAEIQSENQMREELTSDNFVEDLEAVTKETELTDENTPVAATTETSQMQEVIEDTQITDSDMSILDELDKLDSLGLGELDSEYGSEDEEPAQMQTESIPQDDMEIEINEEEQPVASGFDNPDSSLGVLYNENNSPELNDIELEQPAAASYDFRPEKRSSKLMPLFAIVAAVVIVGAIVGFLVKSKNSIDAETLIQAAPENEILATPEADNSDILANTGEAIPDIPQDASDSSAPAPAPAANTPAPEQKTPSVQQAEKNSAAATAAPKPLNGSKTVTVKKVSWEVPDYLSYSDNIKTYLQTAGKSIKLTLSSDLLLTSEYIYSNQVKVDLKLSKDGNIQSSKVIKSSGSEEIDKIVLRTVNDTLNVVKPAPGEVPTPNYNLAIIIYL